MPTTCHRPAVALIFALVTGCQQDPNVPTVGDQEITLTLAIARTTIAAGQPDTIRVTARNTLTQTVRLVSDNQCFFFVTVRNATGDVVTPRDGRTGCLPVRSTLVIAPGATSVFTTVWTGGFDFPPNDTVAKVPPGTYFISAALLASNYSTVAPAFRVTVTN